MALVAVANLLLLSALVLIGPGCNNNTGTGPDADLSVSLSAVGDIDYSDGYPFGVWQDGFEDYSVGTWPPTWIADGNALSVGGVTDAAFYEGAKSLWLYGVPYGTWAGCTYRALNVEPPFEIRFAVRNGNESIGGPYPARAVVGLLAGTHWWDPERALIYFNYDGKIWALGEELGTFDCLEWYKVRIRYERPTSTEIKVRYWINNVCVGAVAVPAASFEDDLSHLELVVLEGSAWFDNVEICSRP